MTAYQLACGHWRSDLNSGHEIGGTLECLKCNVLHVMVIGTAATFRVVPRDRPA